MMKYNISIIIPFLNESQSLSELFEKVMPILDLFEKQSEVIFIDDGSEDAGADLIRQKAARDKRIKLIMFKRNFGQTAAWAAGIDQAKGDLLIFLDADLQNDPQDIPAMVEKLDQGYDVVSGWRKDRKDEMISRVWPSRLANGLISAITGVHLHDYGCSLKIYRRDVIKNVKLYGEMHRFLPAYAFWEGAKVTEMPVRHYARKFGESKYGIVRTFKVLMDLVTVSFLGGFATKPIYFFGSLGMISLAFGLITFGIVAYRVFVLNRTEATPMVFMMVVFLLSFVQFTLMGLLAEISVRTYHESSSQTVYRIKECVNC